MRHNQARSVLIISTVANVVLLGIKLVVGFWASSRALVADGVNSGVDVFTSVMILISFRWAAKPPDEKHPYGHGNIEVLAAFLVSLLIIATGGFVLYDGIRNAIYPPSQPPRYLALIAAGFTIIAKAGLFLYARRVGKRYHSPAVNAQAADHGADILATSAALAGIGLAILGIRVLDPVAAALIAGFIIFNGVKIAKQNLWILLDAHPEEKFFAKIRRCLDRCDGIGADTEMRAHPVGTGYFLELTIKVDAGLSVREGHQIAERVRRNLMECEKKLRDVIVHVEPAGY